MAPASRCWAAAADGPAAARRAPEGGNHFRLKARFARFANTPEMLRMLHVAADIKTAADLDLEVPAITPRPADGRRVLEVVTVEPSQALVEYVRELGERAERVRQRAVGADEDNMLKISGDGRRAALDLRLVGLEQDTPGKVAVAAGRIAAIWRQHCDRQYRAPDGSAYSVRGSLQDGEDGRRHQRPGPGDRAAPPGRAVAARRRGPARGPDTAAAQPQPRGPDHPLLHFWVV